MLNSCPPLFYYYFVFLISNIRFLRFLKQTPLVPCLDGPLSAPPGRHLSAQSIAFLLSQPPHGIRVYRANHANSRSWGKWPVLEVRLVRRHVVTQQGCDVVQDSSCNDRFLGVVEVAAKVSVDNNCVVISFF